MMNRRLFSNSSEKKAKSNQETNEDDRYSYFYDENKNTAKSFNSTNNRKYSTSDENLYFGSPNSTNSDEIIDLISLRVKARRSISTPYVSIKNEKNEENILIKQESPSSTRAERLAKRRIKMEQSEIKTPPELLILSLRSPMKADLSKKDVIVHKILPKKNKSKNLQGFITKLFDGFKTWFFKKSRFFVLFGVSLLLGLIMVLNLRIGLITLFSCLLVVFIKKVIKNV